MKMTRYLLIISLAVLVAASMSFADEWPKSVLDKIDAVNALEKDKHDMPPSLEEAPVISGEEVYKIWKAHKGAIIDVRSQTQFDTERIEGALHMSSDDLMKDPTLSSTLDKNKEYVLYCNGVKCTRSVRAAFMLKHQGFKKLHWYRGGMPDWKSKGYPTE